MMVFYVPNGMGKDSRFFRVSFKCVYFNILSCKLLKLSSVNIFIGGLNTVNIY